MDKSLAQVKVDPCRQWRCTHKSSLTQKRPEQLLLQGIWHDFSQQRLYLDYKSGETLIQKYIHSSFQIILTHLIDQETILTVWPFPIALSLFLGRFTELNPGSLSLVCTTTSLEAGSGIPSKWTASCLEDDEEPEETGSNVPFIHKLWMFWPEERNELHWPEKQTKWQMVSPFYFCWSNSCGRWNSLSLEVGWFFICCWFIFLLKLVSLIILPTEKQFEKFI